MTKKKTAPVGTEKNARAPFERVGMKAQGTADTPGTERRKPFQIKHTLPSMVNKKGVIVGGFWPRTVDGYQPYINPLAIAKRLHLDPKDYVLAEERQQDRIDAAEGLKLPKVTVEDFVASFGE